MSREPALTPKNTAALRAMVDSLLMRLRHEPRLTPVDAETFIVSRKDLAVLLASRTTAADLIEGLLTLLPPEDE